MHTPESDQGSEATASPAADIAANLSAIQARITAACLRARRDPAGVRLLAVSKTVEPERLRLAHAAGCCHLAENKPQEAHRKWQALADLPGLHWSVIGPLQTNKARLVAECASEFQALDSPRVAEALDRRLQALGRRLDVLVQVNTSGEATKHGLPPDADAIAAFLRQMPAYGALRVRGLMTLAMPADGTPEGDARVRRCFVRLRQLRDALRQTAPQGMELAELSMGMSGDFEAAIEEGATTVRIGQAIFGARLPVPVPAQAAAH